MARRGLDQVLELLKDKIALEEPKVVESVAWADDNPGDVLGIHNA